jgi:GNAT superfamily N-acetyltransferase
MPRSAAVSELRIEPLTPERLPDLAALFGQGGDPRWCWCSWFRDSGRWPAKRDDRVARNRGILEDAVRTLGPQGRAPGLVAYRDGEAVGWVSLGPREDYQRLERSTVLRRLDDKPVWSIVCFVVGKRSRGQGVASAMLEAAMDYARQQGATLLEGYPTDPHGKRIPAAYAYTGTLGMFEKAGFSVAAVRRFNETSPEHPIVRRRVRARRGRSSTKGASGWTSTAS